MCVRMCIAMCIDVRMLTTEYGACAWARVSACIRVCVYTCASRCVRVCIFLLKRVCVYTCVSAFSQDHWCRHLWSTMPHGNRRVLALRLWRRGHDIGGPWQCDCGTVAHGIVGPWDWWAIALVGYSIAAAPAVCNGSVCTSYLDLETLRGPKHVYRHAYRLCVNTVVV